MGYNIGPKIGIDGEREFRQQISKINDTYKALQAETRAVTAAFEAQGDEQGKLEALSKQLEKQIDQQKQKMNLLEDAVAKATAKFGEESIEAIRLRGALFDTQTTISTLGSELKNAKDQLNHMGESMENVESDEDYARKALERYQKQIDFFNAKSKELASETKAVTKAFDAQGDEQGKLEALSKQLEKQLDFQAKKQSVLEAAIEEASGAYGQNSAEAIRLRTALFDTQATISTLESELSGISKQLDGTEESMEDLGESTEGAAASALTFKDVMGANLIADLTMNTLREAASFMKNFASGSLEAAADMIAADAQFEQTFGQLQEQASAALAQISADTNVATTRMQGSFTRIFAFAKTAGADSSESLMIASRAMAAAADSAAYYDRSIEEATESLQAFLKGNYANDAALGISATETSRNTMANQLYAKSFKELTEAQKVDTLLAMVEAGNQASGAMGQAARESDSWGNVMGELSEMFRQMQAEAGKPALKALTPVIQRITKAGYKLIEDIDWDKFGKTLSKILDGAIDNGPAIIRILSAVVAGFAAMKAAKMVSNLMDTVKAFRAMGQAAGAAGSAVTTSGAAAMASPWGAVAGIIGAAVGYIAMSCMQAKDTKSEFEKITEDLEESFDALDETYRDSVAEIDGAANSAIYYLERLRELEQAGLDTAAAQREYAAVVEQINTLMPELNLHIDEQTGLLTENIDAILDNVEAQRKSATLKALYEKLNGVIELQAEALSLVAEKEYFKQTQESRMSDLIEQRTEKEEELVAVTRARMQVESKLDAVVDKSSTESKELSDELQRLINQEAALNGRIQSLNTTLNGYESTVSNANKEIEKAKELAESYEMEIVYAQFAVDNYAQSIQVASEANSELTDAQQAVITSMDNLVLEYTEAEAAARESINSQIGLFEELSMEGDWSAKKIITNWESQQRALSNYEQNLQKAVELGLDEGLVQQLSDGSVESMQILDALVNDSGISVDEINEHFKRTDEARASVSSTMAAIQSDLIPKWQSIAEDAKEAGGDIVAGAIEGVKQNAPSFYDVMYELGLLGNAAFDKANDRNSPAKKYIASTRDVVAGAVVGVKQYEDTYAKAMAGLASLGNNAFLQEKLDAAVSYPDMVAASTINNSRSMTNMGGFNIQIYQQPGESAENLAYRVMDIIHDEVAVKEAVFGAK